MTSDANRMVENTPEALQREPVSSADASWLASIVVCPACLAPGVLQNRTMEGGAPFYECSGCHRLYPIDAHGVADFQPPDKLLELPEGALEMWAIAQRRAGEEYRSRSPGSVASPERGAARAFGRFIEVAGKTVLDVGSGTDYFPAYMHGQAAAQYVAMDPLPVEQAIPFTKLQAWAELMPFATGSFDVLLCGTSLDHVVDLESALREMTRVLRPGGTLYLWTALYVDTKWFANLLPAPAFARDTEEGGRRSFTTYRRDRDRLAERIGDFEAIEKQYGQLLVDQFHFRHLPVSFVKQFADYGFALRNLEVWEHSFHEGAIFLNAFLALENAAAPDARAWQIDRELNVWSMLAGVTERLADQRQEIAVIRDVVASGHRHTELAREELRALTAKIDGDAGALREELRALTAKIDGDAGALREELRALTAKIGSETAVLGEQHTETAGLSQLLQEQRQMLTRLVDQHSHAMEQLPVLTADVDAVRQEQAANAVAIGKLSDEQARNARVLASMNNQLQQLWRVAGLARLLAWMRDKSK